MGLYFNSPTGWVFPLGMTVSIYLVLLFIRRKKTGKNEVKGQLIMGFTTLILASLIEFMGVNLKLWTYFPSNWPMAVWLAYFIIGVLGYHLAKLIDEVTS